MLKTIIKRDGRREEFDPAKVNQWAIWASDHIRARVDWSSIVSKAVKACGEEVSSVELQNELIKQCVRKKSWPYQIMAGRLYNASSVRRCTTAISRTSWSTSTPTWHIKG